MAGKTPQKRILAATSAPGDETLASGNGPVPRRKKTQRRRKRDCGHPTKQLSGGTIAEGKEGVGGAGGHGHQGGGKKAVECPRTWPLAGQEEDKSTLVVDHIFGRGGARFREKPRSSSRERRHGGGRPPRCKKGGVWFREGGKTAPSTASKKSDS